MTPSPTPKERSKVKYLVCPGWIISEHDRDRHFINSAQLIHLYGVNPAECHIAASKSREIGFGNDLIRLRPRYDGNYKLQEVT